MKLSQDRANAVRDLLIRRGIEPERIRAIGYGESKPVASNLSIASFDSGFNSLLFVSK